MVTGMVLCCRLIMNEDGRIIDMEIFAEPHPRFCNMNTP